MNVQFYVSGHGFGHLTRMTCVMAALRRLDPAVAIGVRTTAPAWLLGDLGDVSHQPIALDAGVIEPGPLRADPDATLAQQFAIDRARAAIVAREAADLCRRGVTVVVSDIPPLAADVAAAAGLPSVAVGNFSWDFIYAPWIESRPEYAPLLDSIRASYARTTLLLRLPFSHPMTAFPRQRDIELLARMPTATVAATRARLGLSADRPVILVAMRPPGLEATVLRDLARAGDLQLVTFAPPDPGIPTTVRHLGDDWQPHFPDVVAAADLMVSKLGYGTAAECAVARTRLLHPSRAGYPEQPLLEAGLSRLVPTQQLSADELQAGDLVARVRELLARPWQWPEVAANGANEVAAAIHEVVAERGARGA